MDTRRAYIFRHTFAARFLAVMAVGLWLAVCPFNIFSENPGSVKPTVPHRRTTSPVAAAPGDTLTLVEMPVELVGDSLVATAPADTLAQGIDPWETQEKVFTFNPDPVRAVWMSALFPGLGQLYNRRYWKLPIVIGGFMGLGYATSWNNSMLRDYTRAYSDLMDNDPGTKSYMDFFPPTTAEGDLDKGWLQNVLKNRKDFYRRNRDLCIIAMVGVYLLAIVDAYVDAQLAHFDITPGLSMDVAPAVIPDDRVLRYPAVGLQWALNF